MALSDDQQDCAQSDASRVRAILDRLPADDRSFLELHLVASEPWRARAHRLSRRDAAIRVALASFYTGSVHAAAKALEADLLRYRARPGDERGDLRRAALAQILDLNQGRTIKLRQIENIAAGARSEFAIIAAGNCKP
jgi:anti-sigma factor RsiW